VAEPIEVLERGNGQSRAGVPEAALAGAAIAPGCFASLCGRPGKSGEGLLAGTEGGAGQSPHMGAADEGATDGRPRGTGHAAGTPAPSGPGKKKTRLQWSRVSHMNENSPSPARGGRVPPAGFGS